VNCAKAMDAGLSFKPLEETIKNTLTWHATRPSDYELKIGPKLDKERELLEKWHAANHR